MSKYVEMFSVQSYQVDYGNLITPENLVNILQECANHQMRDRKPTYYQLLNEGKSLIVSRLKVIFKGPIFMYDDLKVATWKAGTKGMVLNRGYQALFHDQEVAVAVGSWAVVDRWKGKLCRPEEIDLSSYEEDTILDIDLRPFKKVGTSQLESFDYLGDYVVKSSDADMNFHMNNAKYFKIFWDIVEEHWDDSQSYPYPIEIDVKYGREAMIGSVLELYLKKNDDFWQVATVIDGKIGAQCNMKLGKRSIWGLRNERKV